MAFSEDIVEQAWKRSGGKCECKRWTHNHNYDPHSERLKCLYNQCGKIFTYEQALKEESAFQTSLAKKPYPKLPPTNTWIPNDQYEK
jgi:hypothetical protein